MEAMMRVYSVLLIGSFVALAACGQNTQTASDSSAPPAQSLPANDLGNTYPSQTGETATTTPGAQGGRGSATTGASGPGPAPDANAQQQQTTPP
jgi:hypothetical protein